MKIRTGFVSNSSSSSFVIGKCYMNKQQIDEFSRLAGVLNDAHNYDDDDEQNIMWNNKLVPCDENTCIFESEYYFFGILGYANGDFVDEFMSDNDLSEYFTCEE